jgi:signal transduction histidine kinase
MIDFLFLNKLLIITINILGIWLGLFVYLNNRKSKINQLFLLMMLLSLLWVTLCYFSGSMTNNLELSLFLARSAYGATILFVIPFYLFFTLLTKTKTTRLINLTVPLASVSIFVLTVFTEFMVTGMTPAKIIGLDIGVVPIVGGGKFLYFGFVFLVSALVIVKILKKYYTAPRDEKIKLQYFLLGILIFIIVNLIFNVILTLNIGDARYYQIGNYSIIFLLAFTAYAIIIKKLFEIKVALTAFFVLAITILLFIDIILFTEIAWMQRVKALALLIFVAFGYYLVKSVIREIQQREKLEKLAFELEKANVELRKLDASKTEFISIASHQLRTPLTAIKGYLSMINEGNYGELPEEVKRKIVNIFESNERLIKLVNDLLNVSRIETGKLDLEKKETNLKTLISQAIKDLSINAKKKKIYLRFKDSKKDLPKVLIDEKKTRQALLNIIDNAIKYTNKGGVTVNAQETDDGYFLIEISDTGEGMSKEELNKVFERFSRGNAGNWLHGEGAGLGLYIARKFIEMHNGQVWADSQGSGKGSQFYIKVPLK